MNAICTAQGFKRRKAGKLGKVLHEDEPEKLQHEQLCIIDGSHSRTPLSELGDLKRQLPHYCRFKCYSVFTQSILRLYLKDCPIGKVGLT